MEIRSIYICLYIHNLAPTYLDPHIIHTFHTLPTLTQPVSKYHHSPNPRNFQPTEKDYNLPLSRNLLGTSTHLALRNSATFLPRKSYVLLQLTPRSRWSCSRKCTPKRFGSSNRSYEPRHPTVSATSNSISCGEVGNWEIRCVRKDTGRRGSERESRRRKGRCALFSRPYTPSRAVP